MNYKQEDLALRIENTYAIFARQRNEHNRRIAEFREKGYISETRRVDFECKRDISLTQFKAFAASLPDLDDEIEISFDGDEMSVYVYEERQLRDREALDKLWAWAATAIMQYRYYLANQHVLQYMTERNVEVLTEHHYQGLLNLKMYELETDNVVPEGFNPKVGE
jgi:hypothetical protein